MDFGNVILIHMGNDFQRLGGITGYNTGSGSSGNTLHVVGIGNDHTFHIFNNTAAGTDVHLIRQDAKHLPCFCRAVGQCDWLCAAHSGDKLLLQNTDVCTVFGVVFCHDCFSPS